MSFILPELPYAHDALEPMINKRTIEFHYGKHHKTYVDKTNKLIEGTEFENATLVEIIRDAKGGIFNNGAQIWNHTFYFESLSPNGGGKPEQEMAKLIDGGFGSFEGFKEKFSASAATLFGSGWAWLVLDKDNKLEIIQESNAGNPIRDNKKPLLNCDVWEHAYYLDYQNKRPDYIEAFWKLVNWEQVEDRLS